MGCGVVGVLPLKKPEPGFALEFALELLEHSKNRGEDGTGLLLFGQGLLPGLFHLEKWMGSGHYAPERVYNLPLAQNPDCILGHTRYATAGVISFENIHPIQASFHRTHLFLVMNGEVSFTERWRKQAEQKEMNLHGSTTDTAGCAAKILQLYLEKKDLAASLTEFYKQAFPFGGFTILGLLIDEAQTRFFYLRDGMRPLHSAQFHDFRIFTSETKPLTSLGLNYAQIEVIPPGAVGIFSLDGGIWQPEKLLDMNKLLKGVASRGECAFEYAYFQEFSSIMHGKSLDEIRMEFGRAACREHPPSEGATISPIPKSGLSAARGYQEEAFKGGHSVKLREIVLRKAKPIKRGERSFLGDSLPEITRRLRRKFAINAQEAKDQVIINVDDSIVRGNVSAYITKLEREAGAKEVRFISAWPPIIGPCYAGIAIDQGEPLTNILGTLDHQDLVRDHQPLEEKLKEGYAHKEFGPTKFDDIGYVSAQAVMDTLKKIIKKDFCTGCFTGEYNYICPINIKGPARYKKWLDEFMELNEVERPEV